MAATCFTNELKAQLSLGGGIGFYTEGSNLSIQARSIYAFTDEWRGGADLNYVLVSGGTAMDINANAHYVFLNEDFLAYALAGFNHAFGSGASASGLNLGVGGQLKFADAISGLAEVKYIARTGGTLVLSVGVMFDLGN